MLKLHTEFPIEYSGKKISFYSRILFTGSCFSENIALRLANIKFNVYSNPFGIIYNPLSLANELQYIIQKKKFTEHDIFEIDGVWRSYDFHSRFASAGKRACLQLMNNAVEKSNDFLCSATHLIITFGTSVTYRLKQDNRPVANNHKQDIKLFDRVRCDANEIVAVWKNLLAEMQTFNADLQIIFTVSPVRHFKEGAVENSRSKSALISAIHTMADKHSNVHYFPSYEIMLDDLRDYRFYGKDLLHPNEVAIDYILEKFKNACLDKSCFEIIRIIEEITAAMQHKPFFPATPAHEMFLKNIVNKIKSFKEKYPAIDMSNELNYFESHAG